jgi:murein DD-endopeptidase
MERSSMRWLILNLALFWSGTIRQQVPIQIPLAVPLTSEIPVAPIPVKAEGRFHLLYEVHLQNSGAERIELTRLEVLKGDASGALLASYQGAELSSRVSGLGASVDQFDKRVIPGGKSALVFLQLIVATEADLPPALRHQLFFKSEAAGENGVEHSVEGASVRIQRSPQLVLAAPLRGSGWVAANGLSNDSNHRRAVIPLKGRPLIPQRFGIDWSKLGPDGRLYHGDPSKNTNFYGYGAEVLAVADAVVVSVNDGLPENIPTANEKAGPAAGNFIMLDLGVKVGDKVRRGQVLALLGNSGNAMGPHLHFHVVDANSPLFAQGMPYVFESFEVQRVDSSLETIERSGRGEPKSKAKIGIRRMEIPAYRAVVRFP